MDKRCFITVIPVLLTTTCLLVPGFGKIIRGSGKVTSETRPVSNFDQISVCCGMQLIFAQGAAETLELEGEDNLLPEIVTTVSDGRLTVRYRDINSRTQYQPTQPIRVKVSAVQIHSLEVSGGGSLEAGQIQTDRLTIELSGGSTASLGALKAESLRLRCSGGGSATLAGSVTEQDISTSGGSGYRAGDLESERVKIEMSGGGVATVWVNESLEANLSGGVRAEYYGRPLITEELSGGSKLVSLGER